MERISTIGLDIAKNVFQVHGIDASGSIVVQRRLRRRQVLSFFERQLPCLVGMEACATAHHWAREIEALGHEVKLMPPRYVKPYVKRNKNDAADAEAICEAVTRPTMRFVPIKSPDQQSVLMVHRTRHLFVRQRTSLINAIRAHLAEFGIVAGVGRNGVKALLATIANGGDARLPSVARDCLMALGQPTGRCLHGTGRTKSVGGLKPSPVSVHLWLQLSSPASPIPACSAQAAI
jgi:transposase